MRYFYKCSNCSLVKEIEVSAKDPMPSELRCSCNNIMVQDFTRKASTLFLKTPQSFIAGSAYAPKDYTDGGTSTDLEALGY